MKRKLRVFGVPFLVIAILSLSLSIPSSSFAATSRLLLGTSSVGGTYYVWGGGWAKLMNSKIPDMDISVEVTGGPVTNIQLIQDEKMELGFVTTWLGGEAYFGTGWAEGKKYDEIRAIFPMYASVLHIYTLEENDIKTIYDFKDRHISVGAPGATSEKAGRAVMDVLNLQPSKISSLPTGTAVNGLKDKTIDAGFAVTGAPGPFMLDLESTHKVRHLSISDEDMEKLLKEFPYWASGSVPKGTYKHQTEDTQSVFFWNVCVADKDLPDDLVYELVKTTFENQEDLIAVDPTAKSTIPENIVNSSIPLHKGALKYYQEAGVEIPDNLLPEEAK